MVRRRGHCYSTLRNTLKKRAPSLFAKTFYERPTWLSVVHAFQRVVMLNAVALHFMGVLAYTHAICDAEAEAGIADVRIIENLQK